MAKIILKQALEKRKVSKRQFAIRIGMRYEHVFRLFREGYDPKWSMVNRWAKALKCRIKDLYRE